MTITHTSLAHWLQHSHLGQQLHQQEMLFFQEHLQQFAPQYLLQIGCLKRIDFRQPEQNLHLIQSENLPADILSSSTQTPWADQTFDCIILAHELDCVAEPYILLHEMWRIVQAHGILILTSFNPYSLWRLGKWGNMPDITHAIPLSTLKPKLQEMGWQIEQGQFMNYLPPLQQESLLKYCQFMELVGKRWYPHGAAVYGLVLRKTVLGKIPPNDAAEILNFPETSTLVYARQQNSD